MYETYYGFTEKPFSLTPDPKYLYRSQSHANAFELLEYAIRRREGFVVITGDIGTGKTTLCRALLEQIDRATFMALVLNPFLSEEDLLKRILLDFGVISREDMKAGRLTGVTKQELIDALYDFLLGLIPLNASAVLIIDEAQNLPLQLLEQIRILSNLETDKEKLLQTILVGQSNLRTLLRSSELRQLDQRISIRYELKPLDEETVAAYVAHRLTIAGGSAPVAFTSQAVARVHRFSGGIPRLINLICDRALLAAFSVQANRVTPDMVEHAASSLELQPSLIPRFPWLTRRASPFVGAMVVLLASVFAVGVTTLFYQRFGVDTLQANARAEAVVPTSFSEGAPDIQAGPALGVRHDRRLPADTALTIVAASYRATQESDPAIGALTDWLEDSGYGVYYAQVDLGPEGRWQRVLAGAYTDGDLAAADVKRLKAAAPELDPQVVTAALAIGSRR